MHKVAELNRKQLREFGLITGGIIAVLFGLFFPWVLESPIPLWPWIIFGVLAAWALIAPDTLAPVYRTWMKFGLLLGKVTTPLILGIVFYLVVLPTGLLMRLFGKDPMARKFDSKLTSYRVPSHERSKEHMERPF